MVPQERLYVPKFAPKQLLLKLSGLKSIESEVALRRLLFLGRSLSGDKMTPVVRELFEIRANFCPVYARHFTSMIFLIILTHSPELMVS